MKYTTLDGRTLDLDLRSDSNRSFFEQCFRIYLLGSAAEDFTRLANLVAGPDNVLLRTTNGRVTNTVWEHPLFQAVRDLEDRLGIRIGELAAVPGDAGAGAPLADSQPSLDSAPSTKRRGRGSKAAPRDPTKT